MLNNVIQQKEWVFQLSLINWVFVLFNKTILRHKKRRIQSKKHKWWTYEINKISLSCFNDKTYVLDDGVYTLAYFHKDSITSCNNWKGL